MFIYFYTHTTCVHTLNVKDLYMLKEDLSKNAYLSWFEKQKYKNFGNDSKIWITYVNIQENIFDSIHIYPFWHPKLQLVNSSLVFENYTNDNSVCCRLDFKTKIQDICFRHITLPLRTLLEKNKKRKKCWITLIILTFLSRNEAYSINLRW